MTAQSKRVHPNITLAVLAVGAIAYAVLSAAVIPALPTIQRDLHTSETGVTWLLTAYLLAASVGTSILGRLGDMYGKERVLLWTFVILALGTLLAAVANSLAVVIVCLLYTSRRRPGADRRRRKLRRAGGDVPLPPRLQLPPAGPRR